VIDASANTNLRDHILTEALTPLDIEREFGLSEGNISGELTLEQLFFAARRASHDAHPVLHVRIGDAPGRRNHGRVDNAAMRVLGSNA
jgi:hypothetical protein